MNVVAIRSFRVGDDVRARTWEEIKRVKNDGVLELVDAVEAEGRRIEVIQSPPAVTLREWASQRKATQVEIELITRQLSQVLGALHKRGVVHLNVRVDNIFVRATDGGLSVVLGGFETATLFGGEGMVEVSADPFYAPPETVGLFHFPREPGLRAWDWWSLGRVIQELVLGRHILAHILDRDVTRETLELRTRAENLLKENDADMRAGAMEAMPAMNAELTALLRGLLTGSRDGRWGLIEVESWQRKEPVKDRYTLPKAERLFIWKDHAYLVSEAAEYFTRAKNWQEGLINVFVSSNTSTLAHFLGLEATHKKTKERFDILLKLGDAPGFENLPPEITKDVVMAVALKFLAGHHAPLVLRGRRIDEACLRDMLAPEAQPAGLATVFGFLVHPIVQQIEKFDADVGRMLGELGRIYEAAAALAEENNWLSNSDLIHVAALIGLCLESPQALGKIHAEMLACYAGSRDPTLDKLFKKQTPGQVELVVIAFTNRDPGRFGYVTHRQWNEEQYRVLRERGEQLAAAGLWRGLGLALLQGPLVFGRLRFMVPFLVLLSAGVAIVGQHPLAYALAGICPVVIFVVRVLWFGFHRAKLRKWLPDAAPWTFRSSGWRCRQEARAAFSSETLLSPRQLKALLKETNEAIGKLALEPAPKPITPPPCFRTTQAVGLLGSSLVLALLGVTIWYGVRHPPKIPSINWEMVTRLWSKNERDTGASKGENAKPVLSLDQASAGSMKSIQGTLEELRRAKRAADKQGEPEVKMSWPFKTPLEAKIVTVLESNAALPLQKEVGEELAQLLVARYDPKTIKAFVAVQVPTEKGVGLMLYDGRVGKISDRKVYMIGFVPFPRSWLEIDSKKAIFLNGQ